jgi:hypothetical protein
VNDDFEATAQRIAERGRDALVERLRAAYSSAAKTHADILVMDEERIEGMVQRSVEKADGMQWRRALATVASEELGISTTEALTHPAVTRAQEIVGAPTYEDSLAQLRQSMGTPAPAPAQDAPAGAGEAGEQASDEPGPTEAEAEATAEAEPDEHDGEQLVSDQEEGDEPAAETHTDDSEGEGHDGEADSSAPVPTYTVPAGADAPEAADAAAEADSAPADEHEAAAYGEPAAGLEGAPPVQAPDTLRVTAVHLGGVANLPASQQGIDLRVSVDGLDIIEGDDDIIGRLSWAEIDTLEVPSARGRMRRRGTRAKLIVRTKQGDASFEVPAFSSDELRDRLQPLIDRFAHS